MRDATFISAREGWVISDGQLLHTSDGAATWAVVGPVPANVTHVRFASASVGYAWRPLDRLWTTTDSGTSWHDGGLDQVTSLEIGGDAAWVITGPLPGPHVRRSTVGSTSWRGLGSAPNREATLDVHGDTAYVVGQQGAGPVLPALSVWSANGARRQDRRLPCGRHHPVPFAPLGVSTDGVVALVCNRESSSGSSQSAWSSSDAGITWTGIPPPPFAPTDITATRRGVVAYARGVSVLRGGSWHAVLRAPRHARAQFVGFVDDDFGVAVLSNGTFFRTTDGGASWQPVDVTREAR